VNRGPNQHAVGEVASEHLGPILYALEVCAKAMDSAGRADDMEYYRALARRLARAGGEPTAPDQTDDAATPREG
jgi:hypothetical protein